MYLEILGTSPQVKVMASPIAGSAEGLVVCFVTFVNEIERHCGPTGLGVGAIEAIAVGVGLGDKVGVATGLGVGEGEAGEQVRLVGLLVKRHL